MKTQAKLSLLARRRAISLIEGVLYLVIALAVIVGGIVFFQQSQLSNAVTDTARAAVGISSQARALYQNQTGFGNNEDLTLAMIRSGVVPSNFIDDTGDTIAHPFGGGGMTVTGNGKGFIIAYSDFSQAACMRLASIDETGVGPMGTGIVGLTISEEGPVDITNEPVIVGTVTADDISSACADGAEMAVYYAQNPGAKYDAPPSPFNTDNPWEYPYPKVSLGNQCGDSPTKASEMATWRQCLTEWGHATYGEDLSNRNTMCGAKPNERNWDRTPPDWPLWFRKAEDTWEECSNVWRYHL
jgi:hypothetical protein